MYIMELVLAYTGNHNILLSNKLCNVYCPSFTFFPFLLESWSIHYNQETGVVLLRSLRWLGFIAYHKPNTSKHGYLYNGTGEKNNDILFML